MRDVPIGAAVRSGELLVLASIEWWLVRLGEKLCGNVEGEGEGEGDGGRGVFMGLGFCFVGLKGEMEVGRRLMRGDPRDRSTETDEKSQHGNAG